MRRWIRLSGTVQQTLFIAVAQERGPAHYVRKKYTLYKWLNLGRLRVARAKADLALSKPRMT